MTLMLALLLSAGAATAQQVRPDKRTGQVITENTAVAKVPENTMEIMSDTVNQNTKRILTAVTLRNTMYSLDMQARENLNGFRRESRAYRRLVYEVVYLVQSATLLINEAARNPHHLVFVTTKTAKLLLEAKNFVKYAVVVAMNGNVPNPFRVSIEDFQADLARVPSYNADASTDQKVDDQYNLLLPDDRIAILQQTRTQLRNIRKAMDQMYWKLLTDFNVRNLIWAASRMDGKLYDRTAAEVQYLMSNLDRATFWD